MLMVRIFINIAGRYFHAARRHRFS